jgi:predicted aconitase
MADLLAARDELSIAPQKSAGLDAVVLGCPHFSYMEFQTLLELVRKMGKPLAEGVRLIILTNQLSIALLERGGLLDEVTGFGAELISDSCVFHSPIVSAGAKVIMTNSGKCAYYAPGELNTQVVFGDMEDCIRSAVLGKIIRKEDAWKND